MNIVGLEFGVKHRLLGDHIGMTGTIMGRSDWKLHHQGHHLLSYMPLNFEKKCIGMCVTCVPTDSIINFGP